MRNIFTVDLEDWYHGNFLPPEEGVRRTRGDHVVNPTRKILAMLQATENRATFFVLGEVAEKFPDLIREIHAAGHEIASHGYEHRLVYERSPEEFGEDLRRSIAVLEALVEDRILGFRAPYWSVGRGADWIWDVLVRTGMVYDSSKYPFRTYLYGSNDFPRFRHQVHDSVNRVLQEIPPTTLEILGKRIPFCGGFYFRILPFWFIRWAFNRVNVRECQPVVFYLHPYEICPRKSRSSKGIVNNFILHANVRKAEEKLLRLLHSFRFAPIREVLELPVEPASSKSFI